MKDDVVGVVLGQRAKRSRYAVFPVFLPRKCYATTSPKQSFVEFEDARAKWAEEGRKREIGREGAERHDARSLGWA